MGSACDTKKIGTSGVTWRHKPRRVDIEVVAGDSYTFSVTSWLPGDLRHYPHLRFSAHIRSPHNLGQYRRPDGFFVPATNSPDPYDLIDAAPDDDYEYLADLITDTPRFRRVKKAAMTTDFSCDFETEDKYQELTFEESNPSRLFLYLSPKMSRHLYNLRDGSMKIEEDKKDLVRWTCYHLPEDANVPPTASGYPEKGSSDWQSSVSLPVLGGQYDSRALVTDLEPYVGLWDLQLSTMDGKYVRTLVTGEITIYGDITRRKSIDV